MPFANPLANPLLESTAGVTGALLAATFTALFALARFRLGRLRSGVLYRRWRTWAFIAPVYALAVLGGVGFLALLVAAMTLLGLREYAALVRLPRLYVIVLCVLGIVAVVVAAVSTTAYLALPAVLLVLATVQPLVYREPGGVRHLAFAVLGWGYIAWFLGHMLLLHRSVDGGDGVLLALGLGVALSDVGAFTVGTLVGGRKLAPRLSPNKTWTGVLGNLVGATAGVALMAFALPAGLRPELLLTLPLLIALGAVWGDLVESSIKREFGASDAGAWLPGFGGLLDRIDSLLIVIPLAFYLLAGLEGFTPLSP